MPTLSCNPSFCVHVCLNAVFGSGMGCFWGAEKKFWQLPGVFSTQVGYAGGFTPNPNYPEVCTGNTRCTTCVYLHIFTYACPPHFDIGYLIMLPTLSGGGVRLAEHFSMRSFRVQETQENAKEK